MGILSKDRCKSYLIPHVCPLLFSVLLVFKKTTTTDWDHLYKKKSSVSFICYADDKEKEVLSGEVKVC